MIRDHVRHIRRTLDDRSLAVRGGITVGALLLLPALGTGVRALGSALGLGRFVLPLLVVAHVPAVVAIIALWSIGCDLCDSGGRD